MNFETVKKQKIICKLKRKETKMKKFHILILLIFLLLLEGCKSVNPIDQSDPSLTESMRNYFDANCISEFEGEHFQAKLLSLAKLYYEDTIIYKYSFVVAPRLDEKMDIYSFTLSLNDEAKNYYQQYGFTKYDVYFSSFFDKGDIPIKYNKETLVAYRFEIQIDNINNEVQKECGYNDQQFDRLVSELYITINFNHKKETLELKANDLLVIKSENDVPSGRIDLLSYLNSGTFKEPFFGPYDSKTWQY